jgi:hypothetical protein
LFNKIANPIIRENLHFTFTRRKHLRDRYFSEVHEGQEVAESSHHVSEDQEITESSGHVSELQEDTEISDQVLSVDSQ